MKQAVEMGKAIGDPSRVRALAMLRGGELCVCQIIDALRLSPATVSRHMAVLHRAGLVERRKQGKWAYYRLPGRDAAPEVRGLIRWLDAAIAADPRAAADRKLADKLRCTDPQLLCGCYRDNGR